VCWDISVVHIALPALAAHIHAAPAGTNGPIIVTLSPPDATGKASGCTSADRHLIRNIARHSGQYYVNVHNGPFPNGALRGQLSSLRPAWWR
jgi:Cu/Zn superoxide dismutase